MLIPHFNLQRLSDSIIPEDMSSLRNALPRRAHMERAQPSTRKKFGLLKKYEDYVVRAKAFHKKEETIKVQDQSSTNFLVSKDPGFIKPARGTGNFTDTEWLYMGALFFGVVMLMFNGLTEVAMTIAKLPVFYKQRDLLFFPTWSYALPTWITKIPVAVLEAAVWVVLTYYVIGFDPNVGRFFKQNLLLFLINQMASGLFQ